MSPSSMTPRLGLFLVMRLLRRWPLIVSVVCLLILRPATLRRVCTGKGESVARAHDNPPRSAEMRMNKLLKCDVKRWNGRACLKVREQAESKIG